LYPKFYQHEIVDFVGGVFVLQSCAFMRVATKLMMLAKPLPQRLCNALQNMWKVMHRV